MWDEIFSAAWLAFMAVGDLFLLLITGLFGLAGITVPEWASRVSLVIGAAGTVYYFQSKLPKTLVIVTLVVSVSILLGIL